MRFLFWIWCFALVAFGSDATIEVVKKTDVLPSLAVENATSSSDQALGLKFARMVISDMNVLTLFNVDRDALHVDYNDDPAPENRNKEYVLRYRVALEDGTYLTDIKFFEKGRMILQKRYSIRQQELLIFIAHSIAFDVNERMGEAPVEWMKRKVVFARMTAGNTSEIVISDFTLTYQHTVVKGGNNVFPQWGNKAQDVIYYTSLNEKRPTLYRVDTKTGAKRKILDSDGMMVCSDVSDDGERLLLTMAPNGQPDIYLYQVRNGHYKQLTFYSGIDVGGQFLGNDAIVFISNRLGYPNVFTKKIDSKSVEQLVYYGKSNVACTVHGDYIVYKSRETSNAFSANTFNLHLISMKTDFIRRLTATGVNEFPRFSDDGSAVLFIKNYQSQSSIGIIRLVQNKNFLFPLKGGKIQSLDW